MTYDKSPQGSPVDTYALGRVFQYLQHADAALDRGDALPIADPVVRDDLCALFLDDEGDCMFSMFRDEAQAILVCRMLLKLARLEHLWTDDGPTDEADHLRRTGGELSGRDRTILLATWDLWQMRGSCSFSELIRHLDADTLARFFGIGLAVQLGPAAIDEWIGFFG